MIAAEQTDYNFPFRIDLNDALVPKSSAATITIAAPGVVSWTAHGLLAGTPVKFSTTGALPTGLTAGTTYYVSATGLTANSFSVRPRRAVPPSPRLALSPVRIPRPQRRPRRSACSWAW